jgi:hypothetical protein
MTKDKKQRKLITTETYSLERIKPVSDFKERFDESSVEKLKKIFRTLIMRNRTSYYKPYI